MIHTIDLNFQNFQEAIAAFLIDTHDGLVLIETGPHSTLPHLLQGITKLGYAPTEVRHVLLSHIHLDHAGAAWYFAKMGAQVYVHPLGLPHLVAPQRLMASATRIYGDDMDRLWGEMHPIDPGRLQGVADQAKLAIGQYTFEAWHTPGHAIHHIAWNWQDHLFTGDVAGVKISKGPVMPPCPPPDIDIEHWVDSIERINKLAPQALYLTHYGRISNIKEHLEQLASCLQQWSGWIQDHMTPETPVKELIDPFQQFVARELHNKGLNDHEIKVYEAANPSWMSFYGLTRYWHKKRSK